MILGTTPEPQVPAIDVQLAHLACQQRRLECLLRNSSIGFLGVFSATMLALWAYGAVREKR